MRASLIVLILLVFCTGCWDLKEINTLAIVTLAGVDKDPESGYYTTYYQVINPAAISSKGGAPAKAAVYSYTSKDYSLGRFNEDVSRAMPRKFFTTHLQAYIISERIAKQGVLDLVNFAELNPQRQANAIVLVSDSPLPTLMNSYTPLEKIPGRFIRSLTDKFKDSGMDPVRPRDMANGMYRHTPTVLPIIHYNGENPASHTDRLENINASKNGISLGSGALFIRARMVGRLNEQSTILFFILNKKYSRRTETLKINGEYVDVQAENIEMNRKWNKPGSHLSIDIHADLRMLNNQQKSKLTLQNLHQIEKAFNQKLAKEIKSFEQMGKDKGWDLLGIQDNGGNEKTWRQTKVTIHVDSHMKAIGNASTPYILE